MSVDRARISTMNTATICDVRFSTTPKKKFPVRLRNYIRACSREPETLSTICIGGYIFRELGYGESFPKRTDNMFLLQSTI